MSLGSWLPFPREQPPLTAPQHCSPKINRVTGQCLLGLQSDVGCGNGCLMNLEKHWYFLLRMLPHQSLSILDIKKCLSAGLALGTHKTPQWCQRTWLPNEEKNPQVPHCKSCSQGLQGEKCPLLPLLVNEGKART